MVNLFQFTRLPSDLRKREVVPDSKYIYQNAAKRYQALVGREDYENNLLPALLSIDPLAGKNVIELGAGTGRVSRLIVPLVHRLVASDHSLHMLQVGRKRLSETQLTNWYLSLESHLTLPFATNAADVIIAGWSFCYAALDAGAAWQPALEKALLSAERVIRPGGKLILIESLGTGFTTPHTPEVLTAYLDYLNSDGFKSKWIHTDYCFKDRSEAEELTKFFFGDAPMPMWETQTGVIVPECTGLWWKQIAE
jgi:ubiquinone/menaquinone biosynthesis C-methylase UbiE